MSVFQSVYSLGRTVYSLRRTERFCDFAVIQKVGEDLFFRKNSSGLVKGGKHVAATPRVRHEVPVPRCSSYFNACTASA